MSNVNENTPEQYDERDEQDDVVASDADAAHEVPPVHDGGHYPAEAEATPAQVAHAAFAAAPGVTPAGSTVAPPKRQRGVVAGLAVVALACGVVGGVASSAVFNSATNNSTTTVQGTSTLGKDAGIKSTTTAVGSDLTKVINAKLPSIVTIGVTGGQGAGTGSGVVINDQGYIVTNAHVATLEGTTANGSITIRTSSGDTYKATLVGYDATADVAVIKVPAGSKGLTPITFADSDKLQVGDTAIAIGSPLGLSGTVTTGIISALNRPIQVQSAAVTQGGSSNSNATVALSAIQTDAAINQGNSGGALLDANGNLIGLNDAIATSGDSTGSIGIGFAIPGDYVKRVASQIIADGKGSHGYLGASLSDYAVNGASFSTGARIASLLTDGPGDKAGLQRGDVITKIDDTVIEDSTQATALIKQLMPNSKVNMTILRGGASRTITVTLGTTKQ